jgi:hypothetical protein
LASISQSIRRRWGLGRNEALDEVERHQAHSQEWLCHEEKKEFNAQTQSARRLLGGESEEGFLTTQADAFAGATAEEKVGLLRSE